MEMVRKALVTAISITVLLLASAPSLANFFGPGFGLNGLPSGWGPASISLAAPFGNTLVGAGVVGAGVPPFGVGTFPSAAIAGPSIAGSPGVFCAGFAPFGFAAPVPVPVPTIASAPCLAAPACGPAGGPAGGMPATTKEANVPASSTK